MIAAPPNRLAVAYLRTSSAPTAAPTRTVPPGSARQSTPTSPRMGSSWSASTTTPPSPAPTPLGDRPGFTALLAAAAGAGTILVESASRFARDLIVQETGHALLKAQGLALVAVDDPDAFTADTPTARLVRQILGAVGEFEKANLVAKLKGARDRKSAGLGRRCEGRKPASAIGS